MKYRTTRKAIVNGTPSRELFCAGYCDLQTLLGGHQPVAYTCGTYGWNFDVYEVYGITICTGYRNMPGKRANNIGDFEREAIEIMDEYTLPYPERDAKREELLKKFCEQA